MSSSHRLKCLRMLFTLLILQTVSGLETTSPSPNDEAKVTLHDLSVSHLTGAYFAAFDPALSMLKISGSKIDKIDGHAFDSLKHLNFLDISDGLIKNHLQPETFLDLPVLEILILRNVGLRNLALNLTNVQELILSQNEIEDVPENAINGNNVNYLDLSENRIKSLENSLSSMKKLSMVDMSKNKIEFIGNDVFMHNPKLLRILMSENRIRSTDGLKHPKLKTLDLFANRLTALASDAFEGMSYLEDLVLAFNSIKVVEDPFKDLIELKYLNLDWNFIEELRGNLFRKNLYLSHLSLQGNKIKSLERFASVHEHLIKLDLSHNEISFIDDDFFLSMPNLAILDLSFNGLKVLTDILQPLNELKVLNVAYNELVLTGYEFSGNLQMTQLNLSSNLLEMSLANLKNNSKLTTLDLTGNVISNFCDSDVALSNLRKLYLKGNLIEKLDCLKEKSFNSLCLVDLRNNPLTCGEDLDDLFLKMAERKSSPFKTMLEVQVDTVHDQCETLSKNESFSRWNSVKRELCPSGADVHANGQLDTEDDNDNDEDADDDDEEEEDYSDESYAESFEEQSTEKHREDSLEYKIDPQRKHFVIIPIGRLSKDSFKDDAKESQSERVSWEKINRNPDLVNGYEEQETSQNHYNWYTIVLGLIGICLTLTCFNLLVFLYIRLRVWRRSEMNNPQKYTFLKNEVYKNTTEPSKLESAGDSVWFPKDNISSGKVFSYGKINEFFQNFGGPKRDPDSESTKNILIPPSANSNLVQNC